MTFKESAKPYLKGVSYLLKLQWQSAGWLTVWQFAISILQGVSQIGSSYFNALILAQFALLVVGDTEVKTIMFAVIGRVVYQLVVNIIFFIDGYLQVKLGNIMRLKIEEQIIGHLYTLDQEQLTSEEYTPTITRVREQFYQIGNMAREFSGFIGEMFGFVAAILALMVIEPLLGIATTLIAIPLVMMEIRAAKWQRESYDRTETDYRINHTIRWYASQYEYVPEIRLLNGLKDLLKIFRFHQRRIQTETEIIEKKSIKYRIINDSSQLAILLAGDVWLVIRAAAQATPLDTLLFARNLIQNAVNSSGMIARSSRDLTEAIVYLGDLQKFFGYTPLIKDGNKNLSKKDSLKIEFKNVSFTYPGSEEPVLNNVSFTIEPNEKVALVGLNGAGKSTIVKLLLKEYLPSSGEILVNDRQLQDYSFNSYIPKVSVLMQNFVVINPLTIRQNISLGNGEITDDEIYKVLKIVNMDKQIKKLPNGLDTRLNSSFKDGSEFSGGQKQRMFIARTLLRQSNILVLDEPTSAIDARTEHDIFNELFNQTIDRSTLIISHRFSTVRKANKILVLDKGEIIEAGEHADLMKNNGLYHELFTKQAEGYK